MGFSNIENILKNNNCNFIHFNSTTSTMEEAKQHLEKFQSDVVVIADEQTSGRGRRGNKWISTPGNIYCSIAINNSIPIKDYFLFSILSAVSIKSTIENFGVKEVKFKWPNDILFENKKFAGLKLETYNSVKNNKYVIIGIGINFFSSPTIEHYKTTHIKQFLKIKNKFIFLDYFFTNFFFYWHNYIKQKKIIFSIFENSLLFLNKKIEINIGENQSIQGIFKGIRNDGSLILYKDDKLLSVYSGNIII